MGGGYTVTAVVGRSLSVVVVVFVVVGKEEQSMARWCAMSDSRVVQLDTEVARKKRDVFFLRFFPGVVFDLLERKGKVRHRGHQGGRHVIGCASGGGPTFRLSKLGKVAGHHLS